MKYKNYIFDYGDVLYLFNSKDIISKYIDNQKEIDFLNDILIEEWGKLDIGAIEYEDYINNCIDKTPESLQVTVSTIFKTWPKALPRVEGMYDVLKEVKEKAEGGVFLISNAPAYLEEVKDIYPEMELFDDIIISGACKMVKPDENIYRYAMDRFDIKPEETFFIDDRERNIEGAKKIGLNGYVFDGDVNKLRKILGL